MYRNLEAELTRRALTREILSKKLNLSISTVSNKLTGKSKLTLDEAFKIKEIIQTDIHIEELFTVTDQL